MRRLAVTLLISVSWVASALSQAKGTLSNEQTGFFLSLFEKLGEDDRPEALRKSDETAVRTHFDFFCR